jgi:hypothetical protein
LVELEAGVAALPQALTSPLLLAVRARLAAELADRRGDDRSAGEAQTRALELLRSNGARPLLAQALSEHARRSGDGGALAEARAICSELGATRWLEQIGQASEIPA